LWDVDSQNVKTGEITILVWAKKSGDDGRKSGARRVFELKPDGTMTQLRRQVDGKMHTFTYGRINDKTSP
jgi:hypothetical protein